MVSKVIVSVLAYSHWHLATKLNVIVLFVPFLTVSVGSVSTLQMSCPVTFKLSIQGNTETEEMAGIL